MAFTYFIGEGSYDDSLTAFLCIGFCMILFGVPGSILSLMCISTAGKGKRTMGLISLGLSIPPTLIVIYIMIRILLFIYEFINNLP
jgi:hypothetical protein